MIRKAWNKISEVPGVKVTFLATLLVFVSILVIEILYAILNLPRTPLAAFLLGGSFLTAAVLYAYAVSVVYKKDKAMSTFIVFVCLIMSLWFTVIFFYSCNLFTN
jgi:hypothetical protein